MKSEAADFAAELVLRDVETADVPVFFAQQLDPDAHHMAAFTSGNPADEAAFTARWTRILADPNVTAKAIVHAGRVIGHVASFGPREEREVTYWLGKEYWGRGLATRALAAFLRGLRERPLHARAATDNRASIRVLEKCGFALVRRETSFAAGRGREIEEAVMTLSA